MVYAAYYYRGYYRGQCLTSYYTYIISVQLVGIFVDDYEYREVLGWTLRT